MARAGARNFRIDSEKPVTAKMEMRESRAPLATVSQGVLLQNLSGKKVTLHLDEDTLSGEIAGEKQELRKEWGRDYAMLNGQPVWNSYLSSGGASGTAVSGAVSMIFLKTDDGRILAISPGQIQRVEFAEMPKITREQPVLTLSLNPLQPAPTAAREQKG